MLRKALWLVLVVCILSALSSIIRGGGSQSAPAAAAPSPNEVRQQEEKQQHDDNSGYGKNRQIITAGVIETIYKNLRDPESFKLHSVFVPDNNKVLVSCVEYFARNGFGGMNREYAVGTSTNGDFKFSSNNAAVWNKMCAHKPSTDFKTYGEFVLGRIKATDN